MKISINTSGLERKKIIGLVAEKTKATVSYAGAPTFAYNAGEYTMTKDSALLTSELDNISELKTVLSFLEESAVALGKVKICISEISIGVVDRVKNIIEAKGKIINHALGSAILIESQNDSIIISIESETLTAERIIASVVFFTKLCDFAKNLKYVTATQKLVENEKYAFRCFLLRIGFIGGEYKSERKTLLANLEGDSAFKKKSEENVK